MPSADSSRVSVLVGGYGGLGRAAAATLGRRGDTVVVAGRSLHSAQVACKELLAQGISAHPARVDISDRDDTSAFVDAVRDSVGDIHAVVNLAAADITAPAETFERDAWEQVLSVNLSGSFWLAQAVGRTMIDTGTPGRIVLLSSTRAAFGGRLGFAAYGASKAGVNQLVRQLATEWAPHGITVNAVAPGFVPTGLTDGRDEAFHAMMRRRIPAGRYASPDEIASAIAYFISPDAGFTTGQVLYVDGGVTASS